MTANLALLILLEALGLALWTLNEFWERTLIGLLDKFP